MDSFILVDKEPQLPDEADFCLILENDCMEPLFKAGERVYVCRREQPEELEPGLFLYKGQVLCRRWCEDYGGKLHLLCDNPKREDMNLCLDAKERGDCLCLGRVITSGKSRPSGQRKRKV